MDLQEPIHDCALPGFAPEHRPDYCCSMCATLAAIHRFDCTVSGLGDFGCGNYVTHQLNRWSRLWASIAGDVDNPMLHRAVRCVAERVAASESLAQCHGDFRVANLVFHPSELRVISVFD